MISVKWSHPQREIGWLELELLCRNHLWYWPRIGELLLGAPAGNLERRTHWITEGF